MKMRLLSLLVFVVALTLVSTNYHADAIESNVDNPIRLPRRPVLGDIDPDTYKINCQSFRVGVEANNLRDWFTIPSYCKSYIKTYLTSKQYGLDIEAVVVTAIQYAETFQKDYFLTDIWVFDVEETLLSNLNYLKSSNVQYGVDPINMESYYEWLSSNGTAVPGMQDLYDAVSENGFEIVLLSGAPESLREDLTKTLETAGYTGWSKLILKGDADNGKLMVQYKDEKRKELEKLHYRIAGNVGDQWSDLSGEHVGIRTFKLPNPVYYVA